VKADAHSQTPRIVRARRAPPILVCRKCLKRSDEGRDIKRALKSGLKARQRDGIKPAKLVMTGCFGLCPKQAVVVASGASLARQDYVLVEQGAEVARVLDVLGSE